MKKAWIWIVVLVLIVIVGYLGRHKIKSMMGGNPTPTAAPVATVPTTAPTASASADIIMTKTDATKGAYLTDPKGMTLYIYDKDTKGVSNCYNGCAKIWPPYLVGSTAPSTLPTNITTVKRTDGTMIYAYNGMPLYYYAKDQKPGDITGDGVGGVWHIIKP